MDHDSELSWTSQPHALRSPEQSIWPSAESEPYSTDRRVGVRLFGPTYQVVSVLAIMGVDGTISCPRNARTCRCAGDRFRTERGLRSRHLEENGVACDVAFAMTGAAR